MFQNLKQTKKILRENFCGFWAVTEQKEEKKKFRSNAFLASWLVSFPSSYFSLNGNTEHKETLTSTMMSMNSKCNLLYHKHAIKFHVKCNKLIQHQAGNNLSVTVSTESSTVTYYPFSSLKITQ